MGGLFVAAGRGVPAGTKLGEVHSLDVAPTVLALLGVPTPVWMEGRPLEAFQGLGSASKGSEAAVAGGGIR
jgi:arylsulfatase A-like enzyme